MKKEFKMCPVTKFVVWFILGIIVCLIGITNVFADTIDFKVQDYQVYYDNNGSSVSQVGQSWVSSFNAYVSNNITTSANSYGAGVVISSGIPIISGHAYSLSFYFVEKSNIALSSKNRIALGSSVANAASNYANGNYNATMITSKVVNNTTLQFAFTANSSSQFIFIPWTTTSSTTQTYVFTDYIINDLGASGGVSQSDINNSLNSQTNVLNQSITNSQNAIIQNQNENTQIINDGLNNVSDQLGSCYTNMLDMRHPTSQTATLTYSGTWITYTGSWNNAYWDIPITKSGSYTVSTDNNLYNNVLISLYYVTPQGVRTDWLGDIGSGGNSTTITTSYDTGYIRVILYDTNNSSTTADISKLRFTNTSSKVEYSQYNVSQCTSKLDETNNQLNDLNNNITDDNVDSSSWSNFFNNFTTNTFGLTSIVTAPLNLIQSLTNTTCTDLQLPLPYLQNKYLTLPCMTTIYSQYFGTFFTLYQTITYGIIAYWVCVRIFNLVKDFKNPDHDEIEVVDL